MLLNKLGCSESALFITNTKGEKFAITVVRNALEQVGKL